MRTHGVYRVVSVALAALLVACGGSGSGSSSAPDTQAPSVPAGLTSSARSTGSITLTWTPATDNVAVTGYQIYRDQVMVGESTEATFVDSGLLAGHDYHYALRARDAAGNGSALSESLTLSTPVADVASGIALMKQPHELDAHPLGIASGIGWWAKPVYADASIMRTYPDADHLPYWSSMGPEWLGWRTAVQQKYPGAWHGIVPWFTVFRAADANGRDLNQASNTGVVIGHIGLWFLSRSQHQWLSAGSRRLAVWDNLYDPVSGGNTPNPATRELSGGKLFAVPANAFVHGGWGVTRLPMADNSDIAAVLITIEHRLDLLDPTQADDRAQARFIVQAGADYYPDENTKASDMVFQVDVNGSTKRMDFIPPVAIGPFLYAKNDWRLSALVVKADDVTEADVLAAGVPAN